MKAERRHELQQNSLIHTAQNLPALWKAYGSKVALVLVLALLAFALVRMWTNNRAQAKLAFAEQLTGARAELEGLRERRETPPRRDRSDPQMMSREDFDETRIAEARKGTWSKVETAVSQVLKESSDPAQQAEAKLLRADLNYHFGLLSMIGELPGAATRPAQLKLEQSAAEYFARATQNYTDVMNQAATLPDQAAAARLGLGAIAENQQNFPAAREQYEAVKTAHPDTILAKIAESRLQMIFRLKPPFLIGPPQSQESMLRAMMLSAGIDPDAQPPATTQAATEPSTTQASTTQASPTQPTTSQPATLPLTTISPSTLPAVSPATQPISPSVPATMPSSGPSVK